MTEGWSFDEANGKVCVKHWIWRAELWFGVWGAVLYEELNRNSPGLFLDRRQYARLKSCCDSLWQNRFAAKVMRHHHGKRAGEWVRRLVSKELRTTLRTCLGLIFHAYGFWWHTARRDNLIEEINHNHKCKKRKYANLECIFKISEPSWHVDQLKSFSGPYS